MSSYKRKDVPDDLNLVMVRSDGEIARDLADQLSHMHMHWPAWIRNMDTGKNGPVMRDKEVIVSWHGIVRARQDGYKARCGGPALCGQCKLEKQLYAFEL
jgi:hypothetical protein